MRYGTRAWPALLAAAGALAGCVSAYDPYAGYTPEERAKLEADDRVRYQALSEGSAQQWQEQRDAETLTDEMLSQRIRSGNTSPVEGIRARGWDRFEGRLDFTRDPYTGRTAVVYGKGTYYSRPQYGVSPYSSHGQYRGDFRQFWDPPREGRARTGAYVMIGTFVRHDGAQDTGIYVADLSGRIPLSFVKATPGYLAQLEQRYDAQVAAFREQEQRRLQAERSGGGSGFGALLALGLGGLILSSADIPGGDVAQIGAALFKDVMTDGQSQALASIARSGRGSYGASTLGGGMAAVTQAASGAGQASASAGQTQQYSFSCPAGHSSAVPITYKSSACLAAKQQMTRIYACNLVEQFDRVASLCTQGCGSPQCSE